MNYTFVSDTSSESSGSAAKSHHSKSKQKAVSFVAKQPPCGQQQPSTSNQVQSCIDVQQILDRPAFHDKQQVSVAFDTLIGGGRKVPKSLVGDPRLEIESIAAYLATQNVLQHTPEHEVNTAAFKLRQLIAALQDNWEGKNYIDSLLQEVGKHAEQARRRAANLGNLESLLREEIHRWNR